jgi:hypothetical protein
MRRMYEEQVNPDNRRADAVLRTVHRWREGSRPMPYAKWVATLGLIQALLEEAIEDEPEDD